MPQTDLRCVVAIVLIALMATPVHAQVFADSKMSRVDYSKAEIEPRKACEAMGRYRAKDIVQITATTRPAAAGVPSYCHVAGVLGPEIAFEVSLPARWNGRFYMIGNG